MARFIQSRIGHLKIIQRNKYYFNHKKDDMIELPEAITIGRQVKETLAGRMITEVYGATHPHKFTFYNGTPDEYRTLLKGKKIEGAIGKGIFVDVVLEGGMFLSISDGINMRYGTPSAPVPSKHQLLLALDDNSFVSFTTSMYGGIYIFKEKLDNKYHTLSMESISPLSEAFDEPYFEQKLAAEQKNITAKAFLATGQRIPGLCNGVLQDILFNSSIHPRRKIFSLTDPEKETLFHAIKKTLRAMTEGGGRNTETDFLGHRGRYPVILSKNTWQSPCPRCGGVIAKEAYLGGSVYYCTECQKL